MSVHAASWAWKQKAGSAGAKLVLVKLADNADDDGYSWWRQRLLAEECEMSRATLQRKLDELVARGLVEIEERKREDGGRSSNGYRLNMEAPPPQIEAPPASLVRQHEPSIEPSLSEGLVPHTESDAHTRVTLGKIGRKLCTLDEERLARAILVEWNAQTGQRLTAQGFLRSIVLRIREHPELGLVEHQHLIASVLADPWWKGPASPAVIYGNDAVFENSLMRAQGRGTNGARPRRFGRGVTTQELLERTQGLA